MAIIRATGYGGYSFLFNTQDGTWDLEGDVDASHPRYSATREHLEWAEREAEGTLLRDIAISEE